MLNEEEILQSINSDHINQGEGSNNSNSATEKPAKKTNEVAIFIWETLKIIIISLAIIIPIRYYLVQPFFVKGASMEQNFHDGNYLLIDEISYRFNLPKRGDVIVFRYPENQTQFFIKRIIGLPNETVEIKNNTVKIHNAEFPNGLVLKEDYLSKGQETMGDIKVTLGDNEYFVMGDNRMQSSDSRRWGPVALPLIIGKASLRLFPFTEITKIPTVTY